MLYMYIFATMICIDAQILPQDQVRDEPASGHDVYVKVIKRASRAQTRSNSIIPE